MDSADGGLTVLEGAILVVVALLLATVAFHAATGPATPPAGLICLALGETGDCLVLDGGVYGYVLANGSVGGADLWCDRPDRAKMGSIACTIRLFIGDMGSVDMSRTTVEVATRDRVERLGMTGEAPVPPGNWTVIRKGHIVPFRQADGDLLLEPGEEFELLISPSRPLAPGEAFRIRIIPPGSIPLAIERTVPARITPVRDLG
jgi:hypothetical protein